MVGSLLMLPVSPTFEQSWGRRQRDEYAYRRPSAATVQRTFDVTLLARRHGDQLGKEARTAKMTELKTRREELAELLISPGASGTAGPPRRK